MPQQRNRKHATKNWDGLFSPLELEYEDLISKVNLFLSEEQITIHLFPK